MSDEIIYFYNIKDDKYYQSRYTHEYLNNLIKENQELKKQLEEYKRLGFKYVNDKCNKLENQQKEFIDYLENEIEKNCNSKNMSKCNLFQEILSKYKEIIGVSDENSKD